MRPLRWILSVIVLGFAVLPLGADGGRISYTGGGGSSPADQTAPPEPPRVLPFSLRPAREGEFIQFDLFSPDPVDKWTVSGLPAGLTHTYGRVEGFIGHKAAATAPKTYQVRVRGIRRGVMGPEYQVPWVIEPFADAWLAGTYHGIIDRGGNCPEGAAVKVTVNSLGTGSFSIKGPRAAAESGRLYLAGRGPAGTATAYDPPLPSGMEAPPQTLAVVGVGKIRPGLEPVVLTLVPDGQNVLAGTLGAVSALLGVPVMTFRQTAPSPGLLPKGAAPFSMHLKVPEDQWLWKFHPQWMPQPGRSNDALTFTDAAGRPHLLGSTSLNTPSANDHWIWDSTALTWVNADPAGLIPALSPKLNVTQGQISWQVSPGGDFWTLTQQGGLWKWPADGSGWQIVQTDLPAYSPGHPGQTGVPDAENRPRGRTQATTWVTADGSLWMFGGLTHTAAHSHQLADLWRYQPQTGLWTWMAGPAALPGEAADGHSADAVGPGTGTGPGWVGADGRLWLHQGRQTEDQTWVFDPDTSSWSLDYTSTGTRVQPGLGSWSKRELDPPETGTSPGERTARAMTWTGEDGALYLFGGATNSYIGYLYPYTADFYIWHYEPESHRWVCDGFAAGGFDMGGLGFNATQKWRLPDGRMFLRNVARHPYLNQSDPLADRLFEYSPHPLQTVPGFLSLQITANGMVKWTGRLPDNEVVTGSGGLSRSTGEILAGMGLPVGSWVSGFYSILGRASHTCQGILSFDEAGQVCAAFLDWNRPEAASVAAQRILPGGFPVTALAGTGWRHHPLTWKNSLPPAPLSLAPLLDLPANTLSFGLDSRQRLTAGFSTWTPDRLKVAFAPATGLVTISGTLPDPSNPKTPRPWNLQGLLIPKTQSAAGHFTLPARLDAPLVPVPVKQAASTQIFLGGFESPLSAD